MESKPYAASARRAKRFDREHVNLGYTADGVRIKNAHALVWRVRVAHDDGSRFDLHWAVAVDDHKDPNFVWVFAEHHGPFVFAKNEVELKLKRMTGS
jgi:hypothetical protein